MTTENYDEGERAAPGFLPTMSGQYFVAVSLLEGEPARFAWFTLTNNVARHVLEFTRVNYSRLLPDRSLLALFLTGCSSAEQNDSVHPDAREQQRKTFRGQRGFGRILPLRPAGRAATPTKRCRRIRS